MDFGFWKKERKDYLTFTGLNQPFSTNVTFCNGLPPSCGCLKTTWHCNFCNVIWLLYDMSHWNELPASWWMSYCTVEDAECVKATVTWTKLQAALVCQLEKENLLNSSVAETACKSNFISITFVSIAIKLWQHIRVIQCNVSSLNAKNK